MCGTWSKTVMEVFACLRFPKPEEATVLEQVEAHVEGLKRCSVFLISTKTPFQQRYFGLIVRGI